MTAPGIGLQSLRDEVWKHADAKIHQLAQHDGYQQVAKLQTERVLEKLFSGLGWKVSVIWCDALEKPSPLAESIPPDAQE